ncbi:MAG TPA: S8 family serine peptidase [Thermoanaerobaculia bacterium]|nr:S8 family serine peptidase [Thermoanaerobaculia bacterium]
MRVPVLVSLALSAWSAFAAPRLERLEKIQPSAYRAAARATAYIPVNVYFEDGVDLEAARAAVLAAGGALDDVWATRLGVMHELRAKIAPFALDALAADERVRMIGGSRPFRVTTHNAVSASVSHVTELYSAPYGLTGAGVTVSLFELAAGQESHVEFGGRHHVLTTGGDSAWRTHATHTAGTIGAGGINASAKGMAPKVTLYQFLAALDSNSHPLYDALKQNELVSKGIVADNNSWGLVLGWIPPGTYWVWDEALANYYGAYDYEFTAPTDQIARSTGVLFVHSAGNEGDDGPTSEWAEHRHVDPETRQVSQTQLYCYSKNASGTDCPSPCTICETTKHHTLSPYDTIGITAAGKNTLTVGAVSTTGEIMNLSSRGPTKDGRIKPEVVTRGSNVLSSIPTNSYGTSNGTSMAAPVATGVAALLTEQWRRTFAATPRGEELKAVIIAGARDLGNPGPDYTYGFGLVDAKASADLIIADHADHKHIRTASITQGQQYEMPIVVESAQNVRVVLQWPDPAVFLSEVQGYTAKALVNNLDLKIVGPTGTTYLPYILDKNNPSAVAARGVNTIDNTEMVEIANAEPGAYRIVVSGTAVPQGPQAAVIVTNTRAARGCADVQEPNNSAAAAWGNITDGARINGGFCSAGDVDFYKFTLNSNSATNVTIDNTGDTPLRAHLAGGGQSAEVDVPARSSRSIQLGSKVPGTEISLSLEPIGPLGVEPDYSFVASFGFNPGVRHRSARH